MSSARHRQVRELFDRLIDLPPARHDALLDRECGDDPSMRRAVKDLLRSDRRESAFLETPLLEAGARQAETRDLARVGEELGAYRIRETIGRGGTSCVYLAERSDGEFRHEVAIKLIRTEMDTPEALRRFRAERQILAALHHPNICRLLDGGTSPQGLPYVVMEHVAGPPITEYCDARRLPVRRRLELMAKVCDAVHYAHQQLVVHRDLKPANILVSDEGEPKLLDFGIAKLLDPSGEDDGTTPVRVLTPSYASPEHLSGRRITTASDLFSLGVLLYELLCGRRPYALGRRPPQEMAEEIRRAPLPPPSGRALETEVEGTSALELAAARATTPEGLRRQLRGDLDTIVRRALRFEPQERYVSAERLGEDLRRHLDGRPVLARRGSFRYRMGKLVRRHAVATTASIGVAALLVAFTLTSLLQARRLERERDLAEAQRARAEAITNVLVGAFDVARPSLARGGTLSAREVLAHGVLEAESLRHEPIVQATLFHTLGKLYLELGEYETSGELVERAVEARRRLHGGGPHVTLADSLVTLAQVRKGSGDFVAAERLAREGLAMHQAALGDPHPAVAADLSFLAGLVGRGGDKRQAVELAQRALEMLRATLDEGDPALVGALNNVTTALHDLGAYEEAAAAAEEALRRAETTSTGGNVAVATSASNLGYTYLQLGEYDKAEPLLRQGLELQRELLGEAHPNVAASQMLLGELRDRTGDFATAEDLYRDALKRRRAALGESHPDVAVSLNNLAVVRYRRGDYDEAESLFQHALDIRRQHFPADHPEIALGLNNVAGVRQARGDFAGARTLYLEALAINRRRLGERHPDVATNLHNLGWVERNLGQTTVAEERYRQSLALRREKLGPDHPMVAMSLHNLGWLLAGSGRTAEAEALLREALGIRRSALGEDHTDTADTLLQLADLDAARGQGEQAAAQVHAAIAAYRRHLPEGHWKLGTAHSVRGAVDSVLGRDGDARRDLEAGLATLRAALGETAIATAEARNRLRRYGTPPVASTRND